MSNVKFRGISGVIRRAINNGILVGNIEPCHVRDLLPESKKAASDSVILSSLKHLSTLNEIEEKGGTFSVKSTTTNVAYPQVSVIGGLISMKVVDGKSIVTIEAAEMENL